MTTYFDMNYMQYTDNHQEGYVFNAISLSVNRLRKNCLNFQETWWIGVSLAKKESTKLWRRSKSQAGYINYFYFC